MARYTEGDRRVIDDVAERWRTECLLTDGSLLFAGESVWTLNAVQELVEHFIDNELVDPERTFEEKLAEQLAGATVTATLLMAETVAVYLLFTDSLTVRRKRELVESVLAIGGDTDGLSDDSDVAQAFETGIGGTGQGYNSYRPVLITYLIQFTQRIKSLGSDQRADVLSDPWTFKTWLAGERDEADGGRQMMREILLHLLFPDDFERIASADHKTQIIRAFGGLVKELPDDPDRALSAIREQVQQLIGGEDGPIDFYHHGLREAWDPAETEQEDGETGISHLGALEIKKQVVLFGPPGTGKTHEAKDLARRLLSHQALERWGPVAYLENQKLIDELADSQVRRLQLHQAYSYEDFIRGLRLTQSGATEPQDGYFLQLIDTLNSDQQTRREMEDLDPLPWVLILDEMNRVDLSRLLGECFAALEDRDAAVDLSALHPGGEIRKLRIPRDLYIIGTLNLIDQSVEQLDFALRRRFLWLPSRFNKDVIPDVVQQRWNDQPQAAHHEWWRLEEEIGWLADQASALNDRIAASKLLGEQYELGHTYFFDIAAFIARWPKVANRGQRPRGYLWKPNGKPQPPLIDLWRYSLRPLLSEYLAGIDPDARRTELKELEDVFYYGEPQP